MARVVRIWPGVWAKWEEEKDAKALAERDQTLGLLEGKLPVAKSWLYERHDIPVPADGDEIFQPVANGAQGDPATGEPTPHETKPRLDAADAGGGNVPFSSKFKGLGIPRKEMPQVAGGNKSAAVQFLRARGVEVTPKSVPPASLKPSQADYKREKVDGIKGAMEAGTLKAGRILVSADGYVIDGHHRWLAAVEHGPTKSIDVQVIELPAARALMMLHRMPSTTVAAADGAGEQDTVDKLSDAVLEGLTGVSRQWLGPVRPVFERLAALAMSKTVTDEDFLAALEKAQRELPELFEVLDTQALEEAFEDAIGSAMLAGSVSRYE